MTTEIMVAHRCSQPCFLEVSDSQQGMCFTDGQKWQSVFYRICHPHFAKSYMIAFDRDTPFSFRDTDLIRLTPCHMASENFDAELLLNIRVSEILSNLL